VFSHVASALGGNGPGGKLGELDEDDPAAIAAVARLKEECVRAKEALSADTDTSIPVLLPNLSTEVRLTRAELEAMVRPALHDSIEALKRALRSARVQASQLHSVLLVGGSSRMPIVAQLVGAELGRPVAVDAHPKHAVALGAAWLASGAREAAVAPVAVAPAAVPPAVPTQRTVGTAAVPAPVVMPAGAAAPRVEEPRTAPISTSRVYGGGLPPGAALPGAGGAAGARRARILLAAGAALVVLLAAAGIAYAVNNGKRGHNTPGGLGSSNPPASSAAPASVAAVLPADEQCTAEIKSNPRWVCLTRATFDGQRIVIEYISANGGSGFSVGSGFHLHIYGTDRSGTNPPDTIEGTQAGSPGKWYVEDKNPSIRSATSGDFKNAIGSGAVKVCARIADHQHRLVPDGNGTFKTGNCVPITRT
jgi:hypothetical protein